MPFRYPFRGLFRCVGITLAVLVTAILVVPGSADDFTVIPGVEASEDVLDLHNAVGTNFVNYRGRNTSAAVPSLAQSTLPQPDPLMGNVRALVLLINDTGAVGRFSTTLQVHRERLFSEGRYNNPAIGRAGSVRDYFLENSHGMFSLGGEVWGPANTLFDDDNNGIVSTEEASDIIAAAVSSANTFIDFSRFDNDGPDGISRYDGSTDDDGVVDMLIVINAGMSSQDAGAPYPPSGLFRYNPPLVTGSGVAVSEAILIPELSPYTNLVGNPLGATVGSIGRVAHLIGRLVGLPVLYDTDNSSFGIGNWGLMGLGYQLGIAHNNIRYPGASPAHLSAWSKYQLGWLNGKIRRLEESGVYNLDAIATPPDLLPQCFHFWRPRSTGFPEYFLCEYKVNKPNPGAVPFSYDTYIFDSTHTLGIEDRGVVVWHIDDSVGSIAANNVNVIDYHPRVMVVQADGRYDLQMRANRADDGDVFTHENIPPRDLLPDESMQEPTTYAYDGTPTGISMRTLDFTADSATLEFTFNNVAPQIVINKPNAPSDITRRNIFTILWWDSDPDDDARIELYYSTSSKLASVAEIRAMATAIVGQDAPLSEDETSDRYDWDTYKDGPSGTGGYVPDGQYYIYAVISDPFTSNWNVSRAPLTVRHDMPPTLEITRPYRVRDLADTSYEIRFKPWDDMVNGTTTVELWATSTTAGGPSGGVQIMPPTNLNAFAGDYRFIWDTTNMPGQVYHIYGIIKDQEWDPVVSQFSPGSILIDHKPVFSFMRPCVGCVNDATGTYTIQWQAFDEESLAQINLFYSRSNDTTVGATQINPVPLTEGVDTTYVWDFRLPFSVVGVGDYYIWARVDDGVNPAAWFVSPVPVNIVEAVGANVQLNNLVQEGQRIDSQSPPTAVIGLNLSDDGLPLTLDSIRVEFEDVNLNSRIDPAVDFLPVTGDSMGGIALYRDSPTGLVDGVFDLQDIPVPFRFTQISPKQFLLIPDPPLAVPDSEGIISATDSVTGEMENNLGDDFFIVVRTSENIELNDGFRARIPAGGLLFNNGRNMTAQVLSAPLLANVPTFLTDLSPEDGVLRERGVPYPLIGIGMADGLGASEKLNSIQLTFSGSWTQYDLEALAIQDGGLALYLDDGDGVFGPGDLANPVPLASVPTWTGSNPYTVTLIPAVPIDIPDIQDNLNDVYVVLRLSDTAVYGHTIGACINPQGLKFSTGASLKTLCTKILTIQVNTSPTITVLTPPAHGALADNNYLIQWTDDDPDSNASISLYYDTTNSGLMGTLIVSGLEEDPDGIDDSYTWNTSGVPEGDYYIYAVINDGHSTAYSYSKGVVRIRHSYVVVVNDLVQPNAQGVQWIDADSGPTAVLGLNISDRGARASLQSVKLFVEDVSIFPGSFESTDLEEVRGETEYGIMIYRDDGLIEGIFDEEDTPLPVAPATWNGNQIEVVLVNSEPVPALDTGIEAGNDYFIVIRTSDSILFGDRFRVGVRESGVILSGLAMGTRTVSGTLASMIPTLVASLTEQPTHSMRIPGENVAVFAVTMADNGFDQTFNEMKLRFSEKVDVIEQLETQSFLNREQLLGLGSIPVNDPQINPDPAQAGSSIILPATSFIDVQQGIRFDSDRPPLLTMNLSHQRPEDIEVWLFPPGTVGASCMIDPYRLCSQCLTLPFQCGGILIYDALYDSDNPLPPSVSLVDFPIPAALLPQLNNAQGRWFLMVKDIVRNGYRGDLFDWSLTFEWTTRTVTDGAFSAADLMPVADGGIALWYDANGNGFFDGAPLDQRLDLQGDPRIGDAGPNTINLILATPFAVPDGQDFIPDIFVVVRPSETLAKGDAFTVTIPPRGITYNGSYGPLMPTSSWESGVLRGDLNVRPTITIIDPPVGNARANRYYDIRWIDDDPDDNAMIDLYYDTDNVGFDGVRINPIPIHEDPDGYTNPMGPGDAYRWDTSQVRPGNYYIYAVIYDGFSTPYRVYSKGYVTVTNPVRVHLSDWSEQGARIDATSPPTPVLGINAYDQGIYSTLDGVTVELFGLSGTITPDDFLPFSPGSQGGIGLYRDDGTEYGFFDTNDTPVALRQANWIEVAPSHYQISLQPVYPEEVPDDDGIPDATGTFGFNYGDDWFVVIRTGENITLNDEFRFAIPVNGLDLRTAEPIPGIQNQYSWTANVPTFLSSTVAWSGSMPESSTATSVIGIRVGDIGSYSPDLLSVNLNIFGSGISEIYDNSIGLNVDRQNVLAFDHADTADWLVEFATSEVRFRVQKAKVTEWHRFTQGSVNLKDVSIDASTIAFDPLFNDRVIIYEVVFSDALSFSLHRVLFDGTRSLPLAGGNILEDFLYTVGGRRALQILADDWTGLSAAAGDRFRFTAVAVIDGYGSLGANYRTTTGELEIRGNAWLGREADLNEYFLFHVKNGQFTKHDLLPPETFGPSGVSLWQDVNGNGILDASDTQVVLAERPYLLGNGPYSVTLTPLGGLSLLTLNTTDRITDLFVAIQTAAGVGDRVLFNVAIPNYSTGRGMVYSIGTCNERIETTPIQVRSNVPPTIRLLTPPAENAVASESYLIRWEDSDPDDNAVITLYYTEDPDGYGDLRLIESELYEDTDGAAGAYEWILNNVDPGRYYVVARISDGHNKPAYARSPGYVEIKHEILADLIDLVVEDPKYGFQWVEALSTPVPVVGINVRDLGLDAALSAIELEFLDTSSAASSIFSTNNAHFDSTDLADLNSGPASGILLYIDRGVRGELSAEDILVPHNMMSWATDSLRVTLTPASPPPIPDNDRGENAGIDFIIAIRTSRTVEFGDRFQVHIPANGLRFTMGQAGDGMTTGTLAASIPTFIWDIVQKPEYLITTPESNVGVLAIAAADNDENMFLESLKVRINDLTQFQQGSELVFSATPLLAIPNGSPLGASQTIDVSPAFQYSSVKVYLDIMHVRRGEVRATLLSPEGRAYSIYTGLITDARPDIRGWFDVPLPVNGYRQAAGPWSLVVYDMVQDGGYVGVLNSWALQFTRQAGTTVTGFTPSDLMPVFQGGVAVFEDTNRDGTFNPGLDRRLPIQGFPIIGDAGQNTVLLKFAEPYPQLPEINDGTPDFFVSIRPSKYLGYNDRFSVSVRPGYVRYNRIPDLDLPLTSQAFADSGTLVGRLNQPPYIRIIEPQTGILASHSFRVTWEDFDLDDDARIYIYFDTDNQGYDGKLLPNGRGISEDDETDYLDWDISENNPDVRPGGRYWFYAIITDGKVYYRSEYSKGYVQVRATNPELYLDYIKLHGDGYVMSSGNYDIMLGSYLGNDVATDLEISPEETGFFVLVQDGHIEFLGDAPDITFGAQPYAPGSDAVALQVSYLPAQQGGIWDYGGYVATAAGQIMTFGTTAVDVSGYTPRAGVQITDLLLNLAQDGLYVLYENGAIDTLGNATPFSLSPALAGARAIALRTTPTGNGLYMLDNYGGVYNVGDAGAYGSQLPYFGFDVARGFIVSATNSGLAVMTGEGRVHPSWGVAVAQDHNISPTYQDVFRDIEVIGGKKVAILNILEEIYSALEREDLIALMRHISPNYFDENYNYRADYQLGRRNFFDFYMTREWRISALAENPIITIAGPKAYATVLEDWSFYIPSLLRARADRPVGGGGGAFSMLVEFIVPFTQVFRWYINADTDWRYYGMKLNVYDMDHEGEEFDPRFDREVRTYGALPNQGSERLDFEGPGLGPKYDSRYQYFFSESSYANAQAGPFDINWMYYDGDIVSASNFEVLWEFDLEDGGWRVTRSDFIEFLFAYDLAADVGEGDSGFSGGFDFVQRATVIDDNFKKLSHVRYTGGSLLVPGFPNQAGVVDLTESIPDMYTGVYPTSFDEITVSEIRNISDLYWSESVPVVTPEQDPEGRTHIYAVKFPGTKDPFGLIQVLGPLTGEMDGIYFRWRYRDDFRLKP